MLPALPSLPSLPSLPQLPQLFPQQRYQTPQAPISPEEESTLLGNTLSGVQYVGETLDKPGAAIRGTISGLQGGPWGGGLLNLIPFSDTLDFTDPNERVSGRDLLEQQGMVGPNQPGFVQPGGTVWNPADWDWGDVAGFGVEVGLDPLLFATGPLGALTKSGAAKAAAKGAQFASFDDAARMVSKAAEFGPDTTRLMNTPVDIATQLREGDRGLFGFKAPERLGGGSVVFGSQQGTAAGKWAANKAADFIEAVAYGKGGKLARLSGLPTTAVRGLFSHTAGTTWRSAREFQGAVQRTKDIAFSHKEAMKDLLKDVMPAFKKRHSDLQQKFMDIAETSGKYGDQRAKDLAYRQFERDVLELKVNNPDDVLGTMQRYLDDASNPSPAFANPSQVIAANVGSMRNMADGYHQLLDVMRQSEDLTYGKYQELGGAGGELEDMFARHFGRRANRRIQLEPGVTYTRADAAARKRFAFSKRRSEIFREVPGGTGAVNRITTTDEIWGYTIKNDEYVKLPAKEHKAALQQYLTDNAIAYDSKAKLKDLQKTAIEEVHFRDELMREVNRGLLSPPGSEAKVLDDFQKGLIDEDTFNELRAKTYDFQWRRLTGTPDLNTVDATGNPVSKIGRSRSEQIVHYYNKVPKEVHRDGLFDKQAIDDWYGYMSSLAESKATLQSAHDFLAEPGLVKQAANVKPGDGNIPLELAWKQAGFNKRGLETFVANNANGTPPAELFVDERTASALKAYSEIRKPQVQNIIGETIDRYLMAPWKGMLTIPFLSFHVRNLVSGFWQSATDMHIGGTELATGYRNAAKHAVTGQGLDYLQEAVDIGVLGHNRLDDLFGTTTSGADNVPKGMFGMRGLGASIGETFQAGKSKAAESKWNWVQNNPRLKGALDVANPFNMRGTTTPNAVTGEFTQGALGEVGDRIYGYVEFLNRAGYYEALRKKGFSPSQAAHHVKRSQFDYSELSQFEKSVMRRTVPFFVFSRRNIPYQLAKLAERPGGMAAQTVRAYENAANSRKEYVPSFLREGLAVNVGGTPDATTFLRQGGLPLEDLNKFVFEGGRPSQRTIPKLLSYLHPLATMPIEATTGNQLYTGRRLADLEPVLGQHWLGSALHYSPISRVVGETMSVLDPRKTALQKAGNLATGLKSATYDVEKFRLWDLQRLYREKLERDPNIRSSEQLYIPTDQRDEASPETKRDLKRMKALAASIKRIQAKRDAAL